MKKMKVILALVLASCTLVNTSHSACIIQNGSFELSGFIANAGSGRWKVVADSASITGWVVGGGGDIFVLQTPFDGGPVYNPAQDGSYYVDLSGDGASHGTLYQDFTTTVGSDYSLSFYIGSASNQPSATIGLQLAGTNALIDTVLTPFAPNENGLNWLKETFYFTADSTVTRLSFVDTSTIDDNASFVDNVSVMQIPEPTILGLCGLSFLVLLRRRRP